MGKASVQQFAAAVRQAHPEYADVTDDNALTQAVMKAHPEYGDAVDMAAPKQPEPKPQDAVQHHNFAGISYDYDPTKSGADQGFGEYAKQGIKSVAEAGIGAGKSAINTAYNLAKFFGYHDSDLESSLKDENAMQTIGSTAEKAAEFAGGEGAVGAGMSKIPALAKFAAAAPATAAAVRGAVAGGAVTKAEGGSNADALVNAGIGGALPFIFKGLGNFAGRQENSIVRPSAKDYADGYDVNNIFKYKLGGGLQKTAQKTSDAIESRATALTDELAKSGQAGNQVNLLDALTEASNDLQAQTKAGKNFSVDPKAVDNVVKSFTDRIGEIAPNGMVDPATAQSVKREVGNLGAWQYGARDPEANAVERVSNAFYSKLRVALENSTGGKAADINKQLSDLLPIERALIRRIPVAERNNILNLGKIVLLGTGHPGLIGLEMAAKSGAVANAANAVSKAGAAATPIGLGASRTYLQGSGQ